jgi:flagellar hook-associated protein 3 FlgL
MRIATSTVYDSQYQQIDTLYAQYQQQAMQLSTGKSLNVPSDNPTVIAQDLAVRADNSVQTQVSQNLTNLNNQLTAVDGALSTLTNIMQSARSLAIEGAQTAITSAQQQQIAGQVDQLLQEAIGVANTQYDGKYVFAGTAVPASGALVQGTGSPVSAVTSQGNDVVQSQELPGGQLVATGVTLQQAFNYNAANGSPSVFQTLIDLRDTLQNGSIVDQSAQSVNLQGQYINPGVTTIAQLVTGAIPQILATPLQPDSTGNVTINIADGTNTSGVNVTLTPGMTLNAAIAAMNAAAAPLGVTAAFNTQTQQISFTGTSGPFTITDVPSTGATNSGNFTAAFGLTQQADVTNNLSTQLGGIDNATQALLSARATIGATIQTVANLSSTTSTRINNDTTVQSNLEDTDIAKVTSQYTQTQTVLQAAYATTSRLEGKTLMDYI